MQEVGLMDYQETPRSAGINSTIAAGTVYTLVLSAVYVYRTAVDHRYCVL